MTDARTFAPANPAETPRKGQVRPPVREAIRLICHDALSISEAAQRVGMARESLSRALQRPHVRAAMADVKRARQESEVFRAWRTVGQLMDTAQSEKVRLEAAKTILQGAGELNPDGANAEARAGVLIQIIRSGSQGESLGVSSRNGVVVLEDSDAPIESADRPRHEVN